MAHKTWTICAAVIMTAAFLTACTPPDDTPPAEVITHELSLAVSPAGSGTVSASIPVVPDHGLVRSIDDGEVIQISANPFPGYAFHHWEGDAGGSANPLSLTMDGDKALTACFSVGVWGYARGAVSGQGIPGVTIGDGAGHSATTDDNGYWVLFGVTPPVTLTPAAPADWYIPVFSPTSLTTGGTISVLATRLITKWGSDGFGDGQFDISCGVAVDGNGAVYVTDLTGCTIQKFSADGVFMAKWLGPGSGDGQFSGPQGLAVDASGAVYVADSLNNRIQKFSPDGVFLAKWGSPGSGDGQFDEPRSVAVDASGAVYVADAGNNRIQKFSANGAFLAKWGSSGTGDGQFSGIISVAADASGIVYALDCGNVRIQKFSSDGVFLAKWGSYGSGDGQFSSSPCGVAVDASGAVYALDMGYATIQKFSSDGVFLAKFFGEFNVARGMAVDASGAVYVTDSGNHRIQKLELVQ